MQRTRVAWVGAVLAGFAFCAASVSAAPAEEKETGRSAKLGEKSVTVFPVVITPNKNITVDLQKRLGEVVAMLLERADMKDVRLADTEFTPKAGEDIDQVTTAFGQFIVEKKIATPYALFAEIQGERKKGIDAIRTIVVDNKGNVVLAEEIQKSQFAKSAPIPPKDPMSCCVFVAHRLREPWGLADPLRKDAPHGKVQENWRKKSGIPSDEELAKIKQREARLHGQFAESSLAVCPAYAGRKPAPETSGKLAALLADVGFGTVQASEEGPDLEVPGSPNEQEVLWRTARKARAYFQEHPPSCEYVLVADFGVGQVEGETKVGAVHWILCDQKGDWVMIDFQNSHHRDFQEIAPDSLEDCLELVKVRLKKRLAEAN